jgi:regulatory protein
LKAFAEETDESPASEQISAILDDFKKRGWLSDARFTEQLVHARQARFGSARVANELREKGVADDLIASAVAEVKVNELEHAREVCKKKYKASPTSREDWAKQARFLQSRGFGFDVIKKVLNSRTSD